jgi:hypothetical protein
MVNSNSLPTLMSAAPASTSASTSTSSRCNVFSGLVIVLNGRSKEKAEILVSAQADQKMNLGALSMFSVI